MSLSPGTRLGSFQILHALGAGGMGEVYAARDTKLLRDVALKVLPDAFSSDPERLARFTREAQVLATLNHPNIAQIYGVEESGGTRALVMELVPGATLDHWIGSPHGASSGAEPRAIAEVLAVARQVVDALEAAHERGIVHRDLKPANIQITPDGRIKVLDFGLAKAFDHAGGDAPRPAEVTNSPTMTSPAATGLGLILGTAAYMAPEQARGATVDKRADIWAFGVIVFELLSGTRLFQSATVTDSLAAVLRQDIDWARLPRETPPRVVALLRRCLEREARVRLRDIGEARVALDRAEPAVPSGPLPVTSNRTRAMTYVAALSAAAAITLGWLAWSQQGSGAPSAPSRFSMTLPPGFALEQSTWPVVAISPDGSKVVVTARDRGPTRLFLRPIDEFDPRPLAGTEGAFDPFFSPDGNWIAFFAESKLKKVPTAGGPVVTLADVQDPRGGVWVGGDTIVFTPRPLTPLMKVAASGGVPTPVAPLDASKHERTHRWPSVMPDGRTVIFTIGTIATPDEYDDAQIDAVRLDTGQRTSLLKGRAARYVKSGHLLLARGKVLFAVPMDAATLTIHGSPMPVVDGVSGDATTGAANYAVANDGTLIYVPGDPAGAIVQLVWVGIQGENTTTSSIDTPAARYREPRVAPDGRRVAIAVVDNAGMKDIVIVDTARGAATKVTLGGIHRTPLWSRDGRTLYYVKYEAATNRSVILARTVEGGDAPRRLREMTGQLYLEDLAPDGATVSAQLIGIAAAAGAPGAASAVIVRFRLDDDAEAVRIVSHGENSAISPDGRWLAHASTSITGRQEVFVVAFPSGAPVAQVSPAGGFEPRWAPDGRTLYYCRAPDALVAVPIEPGPTFLPGKPRVIVAGLQFWQTDSGQSYQPAPLGNRLLMMRTPLDGGPAREVRVVTHWLNALKR